jgi:hypothetical protein
MLHFARAYRSQVSNDVTIQRPASGYEVATILEIGLIFILLLLAWKYVTV